MSAISSAGGDYVVTNEVKSGEMILTEREEKLLTLIRKMGFGELKIFVADGQPVRAEEITKSIKL